MTRGVGSVRSQGRSGCELNELLNQEASAIRLLARQKAGSVNAYEVSEGGVRSKFGEFVVQIRLS